MGQAEYRTDTGHLTNASGDEILLRWQSAQVLGILSESVGKLVPRDDLISRVWGDVAVTDDSLTQCIADIRRALGDHDRALLRTLPKRGYLLTGEVLETIDAAPPSLLPETPAPPTVLAAELDPRDVLPTLAVLPMHGPQTAGQDMLGVYVADELANALGRSDDVNVISRLSTAQFWDRGQSSVDLRHALNADFVVSGLAMTEGDTSVLSVEFAETDNRIVLWSDRIRLPASPLMLETDWVAHVVSHVRNAIMLAEMKRVRARPIEDLKLYSVLHGAVGLMHRLSPKDFNEARSFLTYLVGKAPRSPAPLAWMARWHVLRAMQGWSEDVRQEAQSAIACAEQALDIDPDNTLALSSLGFVMTNLLNRLDEAHGYYDAALQINPNDAQARALRGMLHAFTDQVSDGKRDTERALHLTPRDPHRFFYLVLAAGANLSSGDYPRAVKLAKESLRLNRTHVSTLRTLAAAQMGAGDADASRKTVSELLRLQPDLRVSTWQRNAPSRDYDNGKRFAELLKNAGVPE
ncbi:MAG: winged helix-turn-helix domain-containing protein [Pseudomonadota bacterium]